MTSSLSDTLIIKKHFSLPPSKLFELLASPRYLKQWFSPSNQIDIEVEAHDFKEGGDYLIRYKVPGDEELRVSGSFLEIQHPNLVSFTWEWLPPDVHAGISTKVTWRLTESDEGTELTVIHQKMPNREYKERHHAGWLGALEQLYNL